MYNIKFDKNDRIPNKWDNPLYIRLLQGELIINYFYPDDFGWKIGNGFANTSDEVFACMSLEDYDDVEMVEYGPYEEKATLIIGNA